MLADHIEDFLGPIQDRYTKADDGEILPFQVVHCPRGIEGLRAFCTVGLSDFPLEFRARHILQELMIVVLHKFGLQNIPSLLQQLGRRALERRAAFAPGDIINAPAELFPGKPFAALYTTSPGFMPEEFIAYNTGDGANIIFSILLPITPAEEKYVALHGFEKFDHLFIESEIDMLDLDRPSIV